MIEDFSLAGRAVENRLLVAVEPIRILKLMQKLHASQRIGLGPDLRLDVFDALEHLVDLFVDHQIMLVKFVHFAVRGCGGDRSETATLIISDDIQSVVIVFTSSDQAGV